MLKQKIKNGEKTIGTILNFSDPSVGRIAGLAGYDYIWIDFEHSYLSYESLLSLIFAIKSAGTPVIVRAPQDDLTATKKIMEMGVDGIIFPMIRNAEQSNKLISYTLYPPHGTRGCGPINAIDYGAADIMQYIATDHEITCRFIQIEHVDAVKNLDQIIKNDFIDGYIIGASDLSGSINELGNIYGENNLKLVKETISKLKAHNKYVGFATGETSEKTIKFWNDLGVDMITAGNDFIILTEIIRKNKENLSKIFKNS